MPGFDVLDPRLDLNRSYFLEASAGTGKTFTIENCVVRLIEEGFSIDQILVVTFTRAATIELKTRIRALLEKKKLRGALAGFDEAKIFTIHGFCFHTLKEHALETDFALNQTEQSASSETLRKILSDFLITELNTPEIHPEQLHKVLGKARYSHDMLFKTLLLPPTCSGRSFHEVLHDLEEEIQNLNLDADSLFEQLLEEAPKFSKMCDRQKNIKPQIEEGLKHAAELFKGQKEHLIDLPLLNMIPENLLKNKGPYPDLLHKLHQKLIPLLAEISSTEPIIARLAKRAQLYLEHVSENEDLFFFDDLLKKMQKSVHIEEFAQKIREKYHVVLIDEFQDTDPIQWDIFSTLFLHKRPLYLVGDPKQSIYRFRGADFYTYLKAEAALGENTKASLTCNYRSCPFLVDALNLLFGRTKNLITLPKLKKSLEIPSVKAAKPPSTEGGIVFCRADDEKKLFSSLVQEIQRLHEHENVPYKECAVLVKDHAQAKRFCSFCPLPAVPKKSGSLAGSNALFVLEDLLHALYNPRRRPLIAKVLGGPLFGLSLEDLAQGFEDHILQFYELHHLLKTDGILTVFHRILKNKPFLEQNLYLELQQLVELFAENCSQLEEHLCFLDKLKLLSSDSEMLKARAPGDEDAIQVMTMHMSKGLEFEAVFPVGLIAPADMKDEEDQSEKMRQLYVAFTRAKTWLYLPVIEKEKTPMHYFLTQMLQGENLEGFIAQYPYLSLLQQKAETLCVSANEFRKTISLPEFPPLNCVPYAIHSYTSLTTDKKNLSFPEVAEKEIPVGKQTGILLHSLFESLPFDLCKADLLSFVQQQLMGTHLQAWTDQVYTMIHNTLHISLPSRAGSFCLAEVNPKKIIKELEFLYPSSEPPGFLKGYIDLFFEHQGGYYFIDWKSNYLEGYTLTHLEEAMQTFAYDVQASLYQTALQKYLGLFGCENMLCGGYYLFLRGLELESQNGIFSI